MGWWSRFDLAEVEADFARIAACGLDSVRVFLTWEDFQPAPDRVDRWMLERLVRVADLAGGLGLALIPTLFTGHMSGVNRIVPLVTSESQKRSEAGIFKWSCDRKLSQQLVVIRDFNH